MNYENALTYVLENLRMRRALGDVPVPTRRAALVKLAAPAPKAEKRPTTPAPQAAVPTAPPVSPAPRILPPTPAPTRAPSPAPARVPMVAEQPIELPKTGTKEERLAALRRKVLPCVKCAHLASTRRQVVFGVGNPEATLMFVGEAPGADEDRQGEPFVGAAGKLLTRIIETMGLQRSEVYIANVLKCRPDMPEGSSGNRPPTPEEMDTCLPYLRMQIEIIQPKVMVGLGTTAMAGLFPGFEKITQNRGKWREFEGIPVMPTYHPSYLLRNQANSVKREVWEDMLLVKERLGLPVSDRDRSYFLPKNST